MRERCVEIKNAVMEFAFEDMKLGLEEQYNHKQVR